MLALFAFLLLVFVGGLVAILLLRPDTGYVLVNYGPYVAETSLAALVFAVLLAFLLVWAAGRLFGFALRLPVSLREAVDRKRADRAQRSFESGLIALWEGNWLRAESELLKRVGDHHAPHLNYLAAARAAQRLGAGERRDHYLRLATLNGPEHALATLLSQADLQRKRGEHEAAKQTAQAIRARDPGHPYAIEVLAESHAALGEWAALRQLLIETEGSKAIAAPRREQLAARALRELMGAAVAEAALARLKALWDSAGALREDAELRRVYVRGLARLNAEHEAMAQITTQLDQHWDGELALLYGDLHAGEPLSQLAAVEHWLSLWGERPELLQLAGHVCLRNHLWGKARSYLEAAVAVAPTPKAYHDLAQLCVEIRQPEDAARYNRLGLELAVARG
jgi:HemY protein